MPEEKEYLYIMCPIGHNVYKIGQTTNLERRKTQLEKKFNFSLKILFYVEIIDSRRAENQLHLFFTKNHLGGDWFVLNQEELDTAYRHMENLKETQ